MSGKSNERLTRLEEDVTSLLEASYGTPTVRSILSALLINAVEAKSTTLKASVRLSCDATLSVSVLDNGKGFNVEELEASIGTRRCNLEIVTRMHRQQYNGGESYQKVVRGGHCTASGIVTSTPSLPDDFNTHVIVSDILFALPIRRRTLELDVETRGIESDTAKLALANINVGIELLIAEKAGSMSRKALTTQPSKSWDETIIQVWGRDALDTTDPVRVELFGLTLHGRLSPPSSTRSHWSSAKQCLFIEGRWWKGTLSMGLLDILNSVYSRCFDILQGKLRGKDRPGGKILGAPRQQPLFPVVLLSLNGIDEPEETPTIELRNRLEACMLTLLKHYLLESHFHAVPHGLATWFDRELENRFQEIQHASQRGTGGAATRVQQDFKANDFLGNPIAITSKQPVRNLNEHLSSGQQHGHNNCLVLCQQNGSSAQTLTKRNDLTNSMGGLFPVSAQHFSPHQASPPVYLGVKMHVKNEFPDSFSLNAPLSWQAAYDNDFIALNSKTTAAVPNTWSAFGEIETQVAAAPSLPLFLNSPVCHVGGNTTRRTNVIGVKCDSSCQDTFVDNAVTYVNNRVMETPSPEHFRSISGKENNLQSKGSADITIRIEKVQVPSPEPNWSNPTYKEKSGHNVVVMDARQTHSPEHHMCSNDDCAPCHGHETVPQINIPFEADNNNPNKLELTPSPISGTDTIRMIGRFHDEMLLLPSPGSGAITGGEACQSRQWLHQCPASHQAENDNGIKIVATPSPEQQYCNEQERRVIEYNNQLVSLTQSPHFTGRRIITENKIAASPLCSDRHKKRHCSWPSSQNPAFVSLWAREEAREVKDREGEQQLCQRLPFNYFYVEQQRECISPSGLEMESHLEKVLEPHYGDGSKAAAICPLSNGLTLTPKRINDSTGDDKHPQHMLHEGSDNPSPLPMDHSHSRKCSSESLALKSALLVSSPESPPPPANWLLTISNQTKAFHVINSKSSEVCLQPEDIKSSVLIGQVGRKFILVSLLSPIVRTGRIVLCIDQHAADERIRLENLEKSVVEKRELGALNAHFVNPPHEFKLMAEEARIMLKYSSLLLRWRFQVRILEEPSKDANPSIRQAVLVQVPVVCGVTLTLGDFQDTLNQLSQGTIHNILPCIERVLKQRACHSAIRFGDELTRSQCVELLKSLSMCTFPFQCAHGRPSVVPLVDLNIGEK